MASDGMCFFLFKKKRKSIPNFLLIIFCFQELTRLQLDDNRITTIEKGAFMNLNKLKYLTLRGNKLDLVSDEAFQVLIHLHILF